MFLGRCVLSINIALELSGLHVAFGSLLIKSSSEIEFDIVRGARTSAANCSCIPFAYPDRDSSGELSTCCAPELASSHAAVRLELVATSIITWSTSDKTTTGGQPGTNMHRHPPIDNRMMEP